MCGAGTFLVHLSHQPNLVMEQWFSNNSLGCRKKIVKLLFILIEFIL